MARPACVLGHLGQLQTEAGQEIVVADETAATTMKTYGENKTGAWRVHLVLNLILSLVTVITRC